MTEPLMSDWEYTLYLIHDAATRLARLTEHPEPGLGSYAMAVKAVMDDLDKLRVVQKAPL